MRTIRYNVFETNSSSCHSVVIMNTNDWDAFKENEVFIKRQCFEIDEHMDTFNDLRWRDDLTDSEAFERWKEYFVSFNDYYEEFKNKMKDGIIRDTFFKENYVKDDMRNFYSAIIDWIIRQVNSDDDSKLREIFKSFAEDSKNEKDWQNKIAFMLPNNMTFNSLPIKKATWYDVIDVLFGWYFCSYKGLVEWLGLDEIYRYGDTDSGWSSVSAIVKEFAEIKSKNGIKDCDTENTYTLVERFEQC